MNEPMVMEQEWVGFNSMNELNNGIICKAINKLSFNTFAYWLDLILLLLLLLLIPVLFWLLSIGITKHLFEIVLYAPHLNLNILTILADYFAELLQRETATAFNELLSEKKQIKFGDIRYIRSQTNEPVSYKVGI